MPKKIDLISVKIIDVKQEGGKQIMTIEVAGPEEEFRDVDLLVKKGAIGKIDIFIRGAIADYLHKKDRIWKEFLNFVKPQTNEKDLDRSETKKRGRPKKPDDAK